MSVKKQVNEFRQKYKLKVINSASLCEALAAQGYTVVEFNGLKDNGDVADLIEALQVQDHISHGKCFTYQDEKYRIVFIHEDLNEEERAIVLAHEEGHIWHGHMTQRSVFGKDIVQEHEANEFAHHLLKDKAGQKKRVSRI